MFLPGKRKGPVIAGEAFVLSVQKILRLSSVASIADSKNPILMQLKIGLVLFEIELVYHCRVGKGCGGPFLTFAPAVAGLAAVKIIAFSLLPV